MNLLEYHFFIDVIFILNLSGDRARHHTLDMVVTDSMNVALLALE